MPGGQAPTAGADLMQTIGSLEIENQIFFFQFFFYFFFGIFD
jgi:hypothetical protein